MEITYFVEVSEGKEMGYGCYARCCTRNVNAGARGILQFKSKVYTDIRSKSQLNECRYQGHSKTKKKKIK